MKKILSILSTLIILQNLLLSAENYEVYNDGKIYKNKYGSFYLPSNHDRAVAQTIKRGEVWEEDTLEFIKAIYKKGTSIVHAGAYIGDMLPFFCNLANNANVYTFEPVKVNHYFAKKNIELNKLQNVLLFDFALSNIDNIKMTIRTSNNLGKHKAGGSMIIDPADDHGPSNCFETIQGMTLDSVLSKTKDKIGLIHLDIELHEIPALKGAIKTIQKHKPIIIVEEVGPNRETLEKYLNKIGYVRAKQIEANGIYFHKTEKL